MDDLLLKVRAIAEKKFGGHFTILKFTTHYKGMFGTIDVDALTGRQQIRDLPGFLTLEELLSWMIKNPVGPDHFDIKKIIRGAEIACLVESFDAKQYS